MKLTKLFVIAGQAGNDNRIVSWYFDTSHNRLIMPSYINQE